MENHNLKYSLIGIQKELMLYGSSRNGMLSDEKNAYIRTTVPQTSAGIGGSLGAGSEEVGASVSLGIGVSITVTSTELVESISLTDAQSDKVNDLAVGAKTWSLDKKSDEPNEEGYFSATVYVPGPLGERRSTGITVYSKGVKDGDKLKPDGMWMSKEYIKAADEAEKEDEEE